MYFLYNKLWTHYKNAEAKFWTAEDIDINSDVEGFNSLSGKAKSHLVQLLCFYCVDTVDLTSVFSKEIQVAEARCFFGYQTMQQNIHLEAIMLSLEALTLGQDEYRNDTLQLISECKNILIKCPASLEKTHGSKNL
jgi:ribonucleoside-diphosphate reductase subunit M2